MTAFAAIVSACVESGTLLLAFVALVITPFAIWTISRLSLPSVGEIGNDRVRAIFAGSLAIAPGASFAIAGILVIGRAIGAGCLQMPGGRLVVGVIAISLAIAFARAIFRARARFSEVDELTCLAETAGPRLAGLVDPADAGSLREIEGDEPLIFVAGSFRPNIYVSTGALARLSDAELRAALAHERAHARHGDQALMAALLFCTDLVPLDVAPLTDLYRDAREFAADRAAIESADPLELASAILNVVSPRGHRVVAALADACVRARLTWLLGGARSSGSAFPPALNYFMTAQFALLAALVTAAIVLPGCRIVR